jgi:hypothetical protein
MREELLTFLKTLSGPISRMNCQLNEIQDHLEGEAQAYIKDPKSHCRLLQPKNDGNSCNFYHPCHTRNITNRAEEASSRELDSGFSTILFTINGNMETLLRSCSSTEILDLEKVNSCV